MLLGLGLMLVSSRRNGQCADGDRFGIFYVFLWFSCMICTSSLSLWLFLSFFLFFVVRYPKRTLDVLVNIFLSQLASFITRY